MALLTRYKFQFQKLISSLYKRKSENLRLFKNFHYYNIVNIYILKKKNKPSILDVVFFNDHKINEILNDKSQGNFAVKFLFKLSV